MKIMDYYNSLPLLLMMISVLCNTSTCDLAQTIPLSGVEKNIVSIENSAGICISSDKIIFSLPRTAKHFTSCSSSRRKFVIRINERGRNLRQWSSVLNENISIDTTLYSMTLQPYDLAATLVRNKPVRITTRCFSKFNVYGNSPIPSKKQRFVPTSGSYPQGFLLGSTNVGLKPPSKSQPDLILVASEKPSYGAAVFTKNEFPAASVTVSKDVVERSKGLGGIQGIIANSGCANTLTGTKGREDAVRMSREAGRLISGRIGLGGGSSAMVMVRVFGIHTVSLITNVNLKTYFERICSPCTLLGLLLPPK